MKVNVHPVAIVTRHVSDEGQITSESHKTELEIAGNFAELPCPS